MATAHKIKQNAKLVVGVGSALIDILAHAGDDFLEKTGARKGGMTYVDREFIEEVLAQLSDKAVIVPGGSACNTVIGVRKLGAPARFVGKCGSGEWGRFFRDDLAKQEVEPALFGSASPTGRVLSIITPDAQRSMFTYLGAASETHPQDLSRGCLNDAAVVHIEGYLLFNPELMRAALQTARSVGALISLDLSSYTVVESSYSLLNELIEEFVDIVIANEDEARAFTGIADEREAVKALGENTAMAVLKMGERGSYIYHDKQVIEIAPAGDGSAVDTTGAGDLWAAGFLFGLVNGYPLQRCGEIGSVCGYEVCQVIGASIPEPRWNEIREWIQADDRRTYGESSKAKPQKVAKRTG